ncbi:MotA/TolQ/ExbB proton channel family protein [bacterium]|nr:MotA/TolQ/ExbB proton channel family protein [bacterium]
MLLHLFIKGGPVMYGILAVSIFGLYIVIEKVLFLYINRLPNETALLQIISQISSQGKAKTASTLSSSDRLPLRLIGAAIHTSSAAKDDLQDTLKIAAQNELDQIDRNMGFLVTIISAAPMMGLLGTILGLMNIFQVLSGKPIGSPNELLGGISIALIATVSGLFVALVLMFLNQYLLYRIDSYTLTLEAQMTRIAIFCRKDEVQP